LVAIASIGAVIFFADNVREQYANLADEITGGDAAIAIQTNSQAAAEGHYDLLNFNSTDL